MSRKRLNPLRIYRHGFTITDSTLTVSPITHYGLSTQGFIDQSGVLPMSGNRITSHKDLDVWQLSIELVTDIYKLTGSFPKEEIYGLTNQMRRAAVSIPSNIAEGSARNSKKEFLQFLHISLGSAAELETQLIISDNLGFSKKASEYHQKVARIKRMINGLIVYIKGGEGP